MTQEDVDYKLLELIHTWEDKWRLLSRYILVPEDKVKECWSWIGKVTKRDGYSYYTRRRKLYKPYIELYKLFKGEYTTGYHIHHTCENKACVNPMHLVAVSSSEHSRITSMQARKAKIAGSTILGDFIVE